MTAVRTKVSSNIAHYQKQDTSTDIIVAAFRSLDTITDRGIFDQTLDGYTKKHASNTRLTGIFNSVTVMGLLTRVFRTRTLEAPSFVTQERLKKLTFGTAFVSLSLSHLLLLLLSFIAEKSLSR